MQMHQSVSSASTSIICCVRKYAIQQNARANDDTKWNAHCGHDCNRQLQKAGLWARNGGFIKQSEGILARDQVPTANFKRGRQNARVRKAV
jgi:hypothetical protein